MVTIVYKELASHEYVHIVDESDVRFSDAERQVGFLEIDSHAGFFRPELWNFCYIEYPVGVYHQDDVDVEFHPNMHDGVSV